VIKLVTFVNNTGGYSQSFEYRCKQIRINLLKTTQ